MLYLFGLRPFPLSLSLPLFNVTSSFAVLVMSRKKATWTSYSKAIKRLTFKDRPATKQSGAPLSDTQQAIKISSFFNFTPTFSAPHVAPRHMRNQGRVSLMQLEKIFSLGQG